MYWQCKKARRYNLPLDDETFEILTKKENI